MNYLEAYTNLLSKYGTSSKSKTEYQERHHIIPKSLGGDNSPENLVYISARVHFICHRLLCRIHPENHKLKFAWWSMCNQLSGDVNRTYKVTSRTFQTAKENFAVANSVLHKGKTISAVNIEAQRIRLTNNNIHKGGKESHLYGTHRTQSVKDAIRNTKLSYPERNGQFKGYYVTPEGTFASVPLAVKNTTYTADRIRSYCKNSSRTVTPSMVTTTSKFGPQHVGLLLSDLGWGFEPSSQ